MAVLDPGLKVGGLTGTDAVEGRPERGDDRSSDPPGSGPDGVPDRDKETGTELDPAADRAAHRSLDELFELLKNRRRRAVCRYLGAASEPMTLGDLAERIAAEENDTSTAELTSSERKRVYISLYQVHLPKMDDLGVLEFEKDRKTVRIGDRFEEVYACLTAVEGQVGSERSGPDDTARRSVTTSIRAMVQSLLG